jgi:hypothetical protein
MNKYLIIFKNWFAYAGIITLLCGVIYITVQQSYRLPANDPQVQMAEDAAHAIDKGADPKSLVNLAPAVEISQSLAPYLVIYDAAGNIAAGSATLNGKPLKIPQRVIDYVRKNGKDAASWQPVPGVRQAMVGFSTANKAYVAVAGRSLRVTEERIERLGEQVAFGWGMSLLGMLVVAFLQEWATGKWDAHKDPVT